MSDIAGTTAKERTNLFVDRKLVKSEYWYHPGINRTTENKDPRVPMIVVEDADLLLSPRSTGNMSMAQLLNETDGISSNHDRKVVFTTNLSRRSDIDEALMRTGRCYDVIEFRLLTPEEAIAARKAHGLPDFEETPVKDMSLADALRKPRKRIFVKNGKIGIGFNK
jgi:SpoVK/Ycf46/Vps4 family AAA+-type ATPase